MWARHILPVTQLTQLTHTITISYLQEKTVQIESSLLGLKNIECRCGMQVYFVSTNTDDSISFYSKSPGWLNFEYNINGNHYLFSGELIE